MTATEAARILSINLPSANGASIAPEQLKARYRTAAKQAHPDVGGSTARMRDVNLAFETLRGYRHHHPTVQNPYSPQPPPPRPSSPYRAPGRQQQSWSSSTKSSSDHRSTGYGPGSQSSSSSSKTRQQKDKDQSQRQQHKDYQWHSSRSQSDRFHGFSTSRAGAWNEESRRDYSDLEAAFARSMGKAPPEQDKDFGFEKSDEEFEEEMRRFYANCDRFEEAVHRKPETAEEKQTGQAAGMVLAFVWVAVLSIMAVFYFKGRMKGQEMAEYSRVAVESGLRPPWFDEEDAEEKCPVSPGQEPSTTEGEEKGQGLPNGSHHPPE